MVRIGIGGDKLLLRNNRFGSNLNYRLKNLSGERRKRLLDLTINQNLCNKMGKDDDMTSEYKI